MNNKKSIYILIFLSVALGTVNEATAQQAVFRPSVISSFGTQVGSALAQYLLRGDIKLASDVFISEERAEYGSYQLHIRTPSRLIATIPHSVGRRVRGVTVAQAAEAIVENLIQRQLAVRKKLLTH